MVDRGLDQADGLRRMFSEARPRVLELLAGCAGVGRTSVAVNLCAALARAGRKVLLAECVGHAGTGGQLRDSEVAALGCSEPISVGVPGAGGFDVLRLGATVRCVPPRAGGAFGAPQSALWREVAARDWIVVSSMTSEPVLLPECGPRDVALIVSQSPASITDAYALVKRMAHEAGACRFGVIVNRAESNAAALRMFDHFARVAYGYLGVGLEMLGAVPADPWLQRASVRGCSVFDCEPQAPCAHAFVRLAQALDRRAAAAVAPMRARQAAASAPSRLAI